MNTMLSHKVLKVEQLKTRIPVKRICYDGSWTGMINGNEVELEHCKDNTIRCLVNNVVVRAWKVYELELRNRLRNGGYIPHDRRWIYYIWGNDNRRYKFLYIIPPKAGEQVLYRFHITMT
jgi:hypothetical protein